MVMKHFYSKYPFYPEHYEQIAASTKESYYLEELFGEKEYSKSTSYSQSKKPYSFPFGLGGNKREFSTTSKK
jgi:hypothetical protein